MKTAYLMLFLLVNVPCSELVTGTPLKAQQTNDEEDVELQDVELPAGTVQKRLQNMLESSDLASANVSFYAINLETGEVIADHNGSKSLTPASTMKVVTTATALMLAGPDRRFVTKLGYTGNIQPDGTLNGDVVIIAGGDPTLGSGNFYSDRTAFLEKWAASLQQMGIKRVNGNIISDISIFKPSMPLTWIWGDMGTYYGAHAHPLSIYDNEFYASFKSCDNGSEPEVVAMVPNIPGLKFKMDVVPAGEGDYALLAGSPNQNERFITGTLPPNQENFTLQGSIPNPALLVADMLKIKLEEAGIPVTQGTRVSESSTSATVIDSLLSPSLQEIIKVTNVKSMNTYAENLLLHTALWQGKFADPVTAGKNVVRFWNSKGVNTHGMFMDDGSGLSRSNGVSAKHLVGILQTVYKSPYCSNFMSSLPVAGRSGSLTSIGGGTRAVGNMAAKSGYMTRVRSYAGYVKNRKDETIAFAIIVNNYTSSPSAVKYKMANVMTSLADL